MRTSHYVGKAGEHAVASQLLLRGIPVAFPQVDVGTDLFAGQGLRIQVKSAMLHDYRTNGGYMFTLDKKIRTSNGSYRVKKHDLHKNVDFVVFWGVDESRFWIVPSREFDTNPPTRTLYLGCNNPRLSVSTPDILSAVSSCSGNQREAAKLLGVSEMTVSRAVNGIGRTTSPISLKASSFEGAWHEIISAVSLVNQVDETLTEEKVSR